MYVTIRNYTNVKSPDEVATKVRNEFLPIVSKIPGFHDYYAIKTGDDAMASISVFKDKPSGDASVKAATNWVEKNLSKLLPNPPQSMSGEAVAHTTNKTNKVAA
jgi:hypothetical protein